MAMSFGADGMKVYLNGVLMAEDPSWTSGMETNMEDLILGANAWSRSAECPDCIKDEFEGTISDFAVYGVQLSDSDVLFLATGEVVVDPTPEDPDPEDPPVEDPPVEDPLNLIEGTDRNNKISGTEQDDEILGYGGNDRLYGEAGDDILSGGDGSDRLYGDVGDDILAGDIGNDRLYGGDDNDILEGGEGNDRLYGDAGDDILNGDAGNDRLYGRDDDDILNGGAGKDTLYGDAGDDVLNGGEGRDNLYGGAGADVFVLDQIDTFDNIRDFSIAEGDTIDISDLLSGYDPLSDAITDFVNITQNSKHSFINIDVDGGGDNFVRVAKVLNVTGLTDEAALEDSGTLIVV